MGSIIAKAEEAMKSPGVKKRVNKLLDDSVLKKGTSSKGGSVYHPEEAAKAFISVLQDRIQSAGSGGKLGPTAISALEELDYGAIVKLGDGRYQISIFFVDDLKRESLYEDYDDGVYNLAGLLNAGYFAKYAAWGVWKGHTTEPIPSKTFRPALNFIQDALSDFNTNYAAKYGVTDIYVAPVYNTRTE